MADFDVAGTVTALKQKNRKDGTPIPGFFSLELLEDGNQYPKKIGINATDREGNPTPGFDLVKIGSRVHVFGWTKDDTWNGKPVTYYNANSVQEDNGVANPDADWQIGENQASEPKPERAQGKTDWSPITTSVEHKADAQWAVAAVLAMPGADQLPRDVIEGKALIACLMVDSVAQKLAKQ